MYVKICNILYYIDFLTQQKQIDLTFDFLVYCRWKTQYFLFYSLLFYLGNYLKKLQKVNQINNEGNQKYLVHLVYSQFQLVLLSSSAKYNIIQYNIIQYKKIKYNIIQQIIRQIYYIYYSWQRALAFPLQLLHFFLFLCLYLVLQQQSTIKYLVPHLLLIQNMCLKLQNQLIIQHYEKTYIQISPILDRLFFVQINNQNPPFQIDFNFLSIYKLKFNRKFSLSQIQNV
eukprot:TRINITY_DN13313_c0_g1_i1.p3 TRINITY_DN13313_c0_g1~~TRINITY_DN13313_c0_g1_i1.p3  ORF type:complete len:228 (-),score=-24.65 TRINITY_DN13313_c0_g1_i1:159-842(-)